MTTPQMKLEEFFVVAVVEDFVSCSYMNVDFLTSFFPFHFDP